MSDDLYAAQAVATSNTTEPSSAQAYGITLTLTAGTALSFDLKPLVNLRRISNVQGLFVDNSNGAAIFTMTTKAGQRFAIPIGSQAIMPVILSADNVLTFTGSGSIPIVLVNFPVAASVWNANVGGFPETQNGYVAVSDVALDDEIVSGGLAVINRELGNTDSYVTMRSGQAYAGTVNGIGTTTIISGANNVFVTGIYVDFGNISNSGGSGSIFFTIKFLNNGNIVEKELFIPTAVSLGSTNPAINISGLNLLGAISGDSVEITVSAGSISTYTGNIYYTIFGGQTATQ